VAQRGRPDGGDLGWAEEIADPALRALTEAVIASPVPVLTGGQGVVSGCLRAFLATESGESGQGE
jgi:hypothetical protein